MIVSGYSHGMFSEATWNEAQERYKNKCHLCFGAHSSPPFPLYCLGPTFSVLIFLFFLPTCGYDTVFIILTIL